jgi:predicted nucleotidyltransferase component of viral defense system
MFHRELTQLAPADAREQEACLQELFQHVILAGLATTDFFRSAAFHGGTCLRIIHEIDRFSEDLDFIANRTDQEFDWGHYQEPLHRFALSYGIEIEFPQSLKQDRAVRSMMVRTRSLGELLGDRLPFARGDDQKLRVKLEIDTNPPAGTNNDTRYLQFPALYSLTVQDLPSNFALKLHALLCRPYLKGRDWYDFLWYIRERVVPNFTLLTNALNQEGPWRGEVTAVRPEWLIGKLEERTAAFDPEPIVSDLKRFMRTNRLGELSLWSADMFRSFLPKLERILQS